MFSVNFHTPTEIAITPGLLDLVARAQVRVGARCLHSDFEVDAAELLHQNADEITYVSVRDTETTTTVGVYGVEVAAELRRAWLRGPFVESASQDRFNSIASTAFDALLARFANEIDVWDAYVETSHVQAIEWLRERGFDTMKENAVYVAARDHAAGEFHARIAAPTADVLDGVVALCEAAFPGGYLTRDDFAAPNSDTAANFAMTEEGRLVGFVHLSRDPGSVEGYIDYLVVDPAYRGRGFGRALLRHALAWTLMQSSVTRIALTVLHENVVATSLYESAGFERLAVGRHLRWRQVRPNAC